MSLPMIEKVVNQRLTHSIRRPQIVAFNVSRDEFSFRTRRIHPIPTCRRTQATRQNGSYAENVRYDDGRRRGVRGEFRARFKKRLH